MAVASAEVEGFRTKRRDALSECDFGSGSSSSSNSCCGNSELEKSVSVSEVAGGMLEDKCRRISGEWHVKNTFLDFIDEGPMVQELSRSRAKTTPADFYNQDAEDEAADREEDFPLEEADELPLTLATPLHSPRAVSSVSPPTYSLANEQFHSGHLPGLEVGAPWFQRPQSGCIAAHAMTAVATSAPLPSPPLPTVESSSPVPSAPHLRRPDEQAGPQAVSPGVATVGSAFHFKGRCKPCAFVWKVQGCENGVECKFCHLCGPDEIQNRKRAKKERFIASRQRKAARAAAAAAAANSADCA